MVGPFLPSATALNSKLYLTIDEQPHANFSIKAFHISQKKVYTSLL